MSPTPAIDHVSVDKAPLYSESTGSKHRMQLLWGDRVEIVEKSGSRVKVRTRGRTNYGWVEKSALGGQALLELYFIDVGQGDGILIKTPSGRHLMIDGGYRRKSQDTGKSAADFVDWKFFHDYGDDQIVLDAMIASHCDADHYGGLMDLLEVDQSGELDCSDVRVKALYHAGVGWWRRSNGARWLGEHQTADGESFFTQLVGDRDAVAAALSPGATPALQGEWAQFMQAALGARWTNNHATPIQRLSSVDGYVPGFESETAGEPAIKVLAPVQFEVGGKPAVRRFDSDDAQNTNGNSLLLALHFGSCRILLTGDLNRRSQQALLADYTGHREEFLCDIGKACHHGSGDISFSFLKAMSPAVTIISSGDNEGHDHPRASIVAASAISGYLEMDGDELISPLIYSTELARSVRIGHPTELDYDDEGGKAMTLAGEAFERGRLHFTETKPGGFPGSGERSMGNTSIVAGLIYGLVNVRTDGQRILCATLDERDHDWRITTTQSRF
jgi:beta-lactamase superfamily II metal-dependent hydrolase